MFCVSNCTSFCPLIVSTNKAINDAPPVSVYLLSMFPWLSVCTFELNTYLGHLT